MVSNLFFTFYLDLLSLLSILGTMFQDFKILFCPACSEEVKAKTSNFCDKCGLCFKKKCKSCEVFGFWEHCYECGVKMVIFTGLNTTISIQEIVSQTKVIEKSSDSNIESEPSRKAKKVHLI